MDENSLPISASTIGYIITGIILFFLVISAIVGYKRGFKKSLFRFVWVAVTVVILVFVTPMVSNWLNKFDLSSYGLNISGEVNNLSDIGVNVFASMGLQEYMNNSPALLEFAENISVGVLNVLLFILLFWLTKWILGIPYAIIASKTFDKDVKQMKAYKKKVKQLKRKGSDIDETTEESPLLLTATNKYRGIGMLFGLCLGLLICAVTLFPIVGLNSMYQEVYASITTTNDDNEEVPYLSTVIDDETKTYINSYEDSIACKIMNYSGMSFLSNYFFDSMAKVEVSGRGVVVSNEVKVGVKVFKKVMEIQELSNDFDNISQDDINIVLANVKEVFTLVEGSTALYVFGDELLPYVIEKYFIDDEDITIMFGGEDYTGMIKEAYENYKETNIVNVSNIKAQVEAFVDIAVLVNKNGLVQPLLKNEVGNVTDGISLLSTNILNSATFTDSLVNYFYNVTMFKYKYPELVDNLLSSVFSQLEIEGFESNLDSISDVTLKNSLKKLIENSINLVKSYNDSDDFDFGTEAKTTATLGYLGEIFDTCKDDLLSNASYVGLIDFLQEKIIEGTSEFADISSITNELDNVVSWKTEFKSMAPLYVITIKIANKNEKLNGEQYSNEFDINKILEEEFDQFYDIGTALQQVISANKSKLITNKNIKNVLTVLLDEVESTESVSEYLDDILVNGETIRTMLLNNIWNTTTNSSSITNWADELKYTLNILRKVSSTLEDFDSERVSAEDNTELAELGKAIDDAIANTNLFISNKVLHAFVEHYLNQLLTDASLPTEVEDILTDLNYYNGTSTVKSELLKNIYNTSTNSSSIVSWEDEFAMLKTLFSTDFEGETDTDMYGNIGQALDSLANSNLFKRSIVKQIILHYIDTQTADLDAGLVESAVATIRNIISTDAKYNSGENAGQYQIKYGNELTYLLNLVETANATYYDNGTDTAERVKFYAIGDELNGLMTVQGGVVTEYKSKLLTQTVINQFIGYYIKSFSVSDSVQDYENLNDIIQSIPGENNVNLIGITDYRLEFELLLDIVDLMKNSSATLTNIGATLNDVRLRNSHFITDTVIDEIVVLFIDSKVDVGLADGETVIALIKSNITEKELDATDDDYITMFAELSSLKDYFTIIENVSLKEDLNGEGEELGVGEILDLVRSMTIAGDKYVARDLAELIIDKAKEYIGDEAVALGQSRTFGEGYVDNVLVNSTYKFSTFDLDGISYLGTHISAGYYADLFTAISNIVVTAP